MKTCSMCGEKISKAEWDTLPLVGHQVIPPFEDDPGEVLEMRNHHCKSTLTVLEPFTAAELETEVDLIRAQDSRLSVKHARQLAIEALKQRPDYESKRHFGASSKNSPLNRKDADVYEAEAGDACDACGYELAEGDLVVMPRGGYKHRGLYCSVRCSASVMPSGG